MYKEVLLFLIYNQTIFPINITQLFSCARKIMQKFILFRDEIKIEEWKKNHNLRKTENNFKWAFKLIIRYIFYLFVYELLCVRKTNESENKRIKERLSQFGKIW